MKTKQIFFYTGLALVPCTILVLNGEVDQGLRLMFLPVFFAAVLIGERFVRMRGVRATRARARRRRADLRRR